MYTSIKNGLRQKNKSFLLSVSWRRLILNTLSEFSIFLKKVVIKKNLTYFVKVALTN